jgi:hypothetical protein
MRRTARFLGLAAMLSALTCGGLDTFSVEQSGTASIAGAGIAGALLPALSFAGLSDMNISESSEFENQGVTKDDIDSVKIESVTLTIVEPSGGNFDFLDTIELYVEAEGEDRRLIASGADFADGVSVIALDVEDVELAPYAVRESMSITADGTGEAPVDDTKIKVDVVLLVDVNLDGALCGS